jgi:hypothetical protein
MTEVHLWCGAFSGKATGRYPLARARFALSAPDSLRPHGVHLAIAGRGIHHAAGIAPQPVKQKCLVPLNLTITLASLGGVAFSRAYVAL